MRHVGIGHHVHMIPQASHAARLRAAMNRHALAKDAIVARDDKCFRFLKRKVLRQIANDGPGMYAAPRAQRGVIKHHGMRRQHATIAQPGLRAHKSIRPNLHVRAQLRAGLNNGSRMNHQQFS